MFQNCHSSRDPDEHGLGSTVGCQAQHPKHGARGLVTPYVVGE